MCHAQQRAVERRYLPAFASTLDSRGLDNFGERARLPQKGGFTSQGVEPGKQGDRAGCARQEIRVAFFEQAVGSVAHRKFERLLDKRAVVQLDSAGSERV